MTDNITDSYAKGYSDLIYTLAQQETSKLINCVNRGTREYNVDFIERIGSVEMTEKAGRFADSPEHTLPHSRRMLTYKDFQYYPFLDVQELQRLKIDPASTYVRQGMAALGRKIDATIIAAARGNAYEGAEGATATALPSAQKIAHGSTGLTIEKLREARKKLMAEFAGMPGEMYIACSSYDLDNLLAESEIQSIDTNNIKALVNGEVTQYMGFQFMQVAETLVPKVSTTGYLPCWTRDGIEYREGNYDAQIVQRSDKSKAWQFQMDMALGATRLEEAKVVEIAVTRS